MKKLLACFLCLLTVASFCMTAAAEDTVLTNEEEYYSFTVPEKFSVMTQQNMGLHQAYIEESGMSADSLLNNFKKAGITAFGYTQDRSRELFVVVTTNRAAQNIFSFDRLTAEELQQQLDAFNSFDSEKNKIYPNKAEYIDFKGVKILRESYVNKADAEDTLSIAEYCTMLNGKYYTVALYEHGEGDLNKLTAELDEIMKGFEFTTILQPTEERKTQLDYSQLIPLIMMTVFIVGTVIIIFVMRRSDKKRAVLKK